MEMLGSFASSLAWVYGSHVASMAASSASLKHPYSAAVLFPVISNEGQGPCNHRELDLTPGPIIF